MSITALIVDDDADWRTTLQGWLERERIRTVMLARGDWVVPAIERYRPDVVILDVELPGTNGLHILRSIRSRWPALPVVMASAFGGPSVADSARRLGAAAYLDKPFRLADLLTEISRLGPASEGNRTS